MEWAPPTPPQPASRTDQLHTLSEWLSSRLGRGPALVWLDGWPPTPATARPGTPGARLAAALTRLMRSPVRMSPVSPDAGSVGGGAEGDLLLVQCEGASTVRAHSDTGAAEPLTLRLKAGHALVLPGSWTCTTSEETADGQLAVLLLTTH